MTHERMTQIRREQQRLVDLYENVDPAIQQIMQVATVSEPLARTNLFDLAAKAGVRHDDGSKPSYKNDRDAINAAIESGCLEYVSNSRTGPVEVAALLDDYVFRKAFASGLAERVKNVVEGQTGGNRSSYRFGVSEHEAMRDMRFAFYGNDAKTFQELVHTFSFWPYLLSPFCKQTFESLSPKLQAEFFNHFTTRLVNIGDASCYDFAVCAYELLDGMKKLPGDVVNSAIDLMTSQGDVAALEKLASRVDSRPEIQGCAAFLRGDYSAAMKHFEAADQQKHKRSKSRRTNLNGFTMLFHVILLLKENSAQSQKQAKQIVRTICQRTDLLSITGIPLQEALLHQSNPFSLQAYATHDTETMSPLGLLIYGWIWRWYMADQKPPYKLKLVEQLIDVYHDSGADWITLSS